MRIVVGVPFVLIAAALTHCSTSDTSPASMGPALDAGTGDSSSSSPDSGTIGSDAMATDAAPDGGHHPIALTGQVWYVRLDGGTAAQCTGKADAPYPGTGMAQACAFINPYYLWGDDVQGETPKWKIAGGDSVVFKGGPFRVGYKGPNAADSWGQCPGDPYGCVMPTIPAGTASQTTKLVGDHYDRCTTKTQLFGGYALGAVLNLNGAKHVDVACLELTDHAQCSRVGNAPTGGCQSSYPLDDYAGSGIVTDVMTSDVGLFDLDLHGFTSRGIIGAIGGPINVDHVRIAYNAEAGWDFDDGRGTKNAPGAFVHASYLSVEWSGCNEEYPITHTFPAFSCFDQNSAGYGDGIGTPDTGLDFTCDHCTFDFNTQDGFDLAHTSGSNITVTHSVSYSNMGQQWKMGAQDTLLFQNNLTVHDCSRMSAPLAGAPDTYKQYLSLFCRAAGDGISLSMKSTSKYVLQNNSFAGYGSTSYDLGCSVADCTGVAITFQNNLHIGYANPADTKLPGLFYFGQGMPPNPWAARDHNIFYNFRGGVCPTTFPGESCDTPLVAGQPAWTGESSLDGFDFHLTSASPARDTGVTLSTVSDDHFGNARPRGPAYDIGGHEL